MRLCLSLPFCSVATVVACTEIAEAIEAVPTLLLEVRAERFGEAAPAAIAALAARFGAERLVVACRGPAQLPTQRIGALYSQQLAVYDVAERLRVHAIDVDANVFAAVMARRKENRSDCAQKRGDESASASTASPQTERAVVWVASDHHYSSAPTLSSVRRRHRQLAALGADVFKLAMPGSPLSRSMTWWQRGQSEQLPCSWLFVPMGEAGAWARLVAAQNSPPPWTYVRLVSAEGTAAGQLDWRRAREILRADSACAPAPVYGVLGHPLGHSLSPALHSAALTWMKLPGRYLPFDCPSKADASALLRRGPQALGLRGLSATLPYKQLAARVATTCTQAVERTNAANTLVWRPQGWHADNTDVAALAAALSPWRQPAGRGFGRVLIVGAGGVARAACAAVMQDAPHAPPPMVWARRHSQAQALARAMGAVAVRELAAAVAVADGAIQCTPVGMQPYADASVLDDATLNCFAVNAFVYDTIYRPHQSRLVARARALGLAAEGGTEMFVRQAAAQCEAFYGAAPPLHLLREFVAARQMEAGPAGPPSARRNR